jgi:5-methylcytosine-specific restriction endonuclease McrA
MDNKGIKQVIQYIESNCRTTLTKRQLEQLREMKRMIEYNIFKMRILYRIAIDNFVYPVCPYCKQSITVQDELTIDHIIPRALGGTDNIENLQPMHKLCNSTKGCQMPETTECPEIPVEKHAKHRVPKNHRDHTTVHGNSTEDLLKKCKKIDEAYRCRVNSRSLHSK